MKNLVVHLKKKNLQKTRETKSYTFLTTSRKKSEKRSEMERHRATISGHHFSRPKEGKSSLRETREGAIVAARPVMNFTAGNKERSGREGRKGEEEEKR